MDELVPIGVKPVWIMYPQRITELADAIIRGTDYYYRCHAKENGYNELKSIKRWASEIIAITELLEKEDR